MAGRAGPDQELGKKVTDKIVVFSACDSEEQAGRIARALVEQRLAACCQHRAGRTQYLSLEGADRRSGGMAADH